MAMVIKPKRKFTAGAPTTSDIVEGEIATITYDVMFGESVAYEDLTRDVLLVDGLWTVSSEDYCDFLASARTPCLVETSVSEVAADEAAMMAFALVYDSSANWDDKAPYLEGSDSLQSSNESYMSGASTMGGISFLLYTSQRPRDALKCR